MDLVNSTFKTLDRQISSTLENPYIMAVLKLTLVLYAAQLAPRLPDTAVKVFGNSFVKIIALTLIAYLGSRDLQLAVILAVIYVLGVNLAAGRGVLESFSDFTGQNTPKGTLLEPQTMIAPGCTQITMQQLIDAFGGDQEKLLKTVEQSYYDLMQQIPENTDAKKRLEKMAYAVGLPYNMSLERGDDVAPYVATILMYRGFTLSDTCTVPN